MNYNFNNESIQETRVHEIANSFMSQVYVWMCFGLAVTGGLSWYAANSQWLLRMMFGNGMAPFWIIVVIQFGIVFFLSARVTKLSPTVASGLFVIYASLNGIILAPIFLIYTSQSIASTFFVTAGTFGAMSLYGYTTKKDLSGLRSFLIMGLIGIIIASIVNIWLRNQTMMWVVTYIAVIVFVLLTAYDTQKIKQMAYNLDQNEELRSSVAVLGALSLYLDFINLFIHLLRIIGKNK